MRPRPKLLLSATILAVLAMPLALVGCGAPPHGLSVRGTTTLPPQNQNRYTSEITIAKYTHILPPPAGLQPRVGQAVADHVCLTRSLCSEPGLGSPASIKLGLLTVDHPGAVQPNGSDNEVNRPVWVASFYHVPAVFPATGVGHGAKDYHPTEMMPAGAPLANIWVFIDANTGQYMSILQDAFPPSCARYLTARYYAGLGDAFAVPHDCQGS